MAFFDHRRGLVMGDPVDGEFTILATRDGGRSWTQVPGAALPDALPDEFGFAASGTCLTTAGPRDAWFGTGSGASRVFHSRDGGHTWTAADLSDANFRVRVTSVAKSISRDFSLDWVAARVTYQG